VPLESFLLHQEMSFSVLSAVSWNMDNAAVLTPAILSENASKSSSLNMTSSGAPAEEGLHHESSSQNCGIAGLPDAIEAHTLRPGDDAKDSSSLESTLQSQREQSGFEHQNPSANCPQEVASSSHSLQECVEDQPMDSSAQQCLSNHEKSLPRPTLLMVSFFFLSF
jgi:hypothetical protein